MFDKARAEEFVDALELDGVDACPVCLLELAWELREGRTPHWQTVARVADWVWPELEPGLAVAVVGARMREVPLSEDALRDLRENGHRSRLVRAAVLRLAGELAHEL